MPDPFGSSYRNPKKGDGGSKKVAELHPFGAFWVRLISSGCWTGYIPGAPGTAGTLFGVFLWQYFNRIDIDPLGKFVFLTALSLIGVWICTLAEAVYNQGDCNIIVYDEIIGFLIAASYLRPGTYENEFRLVAITFVIFRFLDIVKPVPLRQLENLPKGWGVMMDDIGAGLITLFIMGLPPLHAFWVKTLDLTLKVGGGN